MILKPKELPCPEIGEDISEAEWKHFEVKWGRYKKSSLQNTSNQHKMDQLCACCTPDLEKSIYQKGTGLENTEEELMAAMKSMAVKKQNTMVNIVKF